jgi:hypothetical protein
VSLVAAVVSLGLVAVVGCNSAVAPSASPGAPAGSASAGSASAGAISADSGSAVTTAPTVIATPTPTAPGTPRPSRVVGELERDYPSAAACLADDLPALTVHLAYPLTLRKRLRSTNMLERSLEEVRRRTKVIGRFPGETSCLTLAWAVMDLGIAGARGLALSGPARGAIAALVAARSVHDAEPVA